MKFLSLSFFLNLINKDIHSISNIKCNLHRNSFIGSWVLYENSIRDVIHLQSSGSIYKTISLNPTIYTEYLGHWSLNGNKNEFVFNIKDKNYYGDIYNNTLKITGNVCEGKTSPCYATNFTMIPLFEQFHNISFVNTSNKFVYLTQKNVTGTWMFENEHTNQLFIIDLHENNTWNSIYSDKKVLCGKWNLFNDTINTNIVSKLPGKNIWLSVMSSFSKSYSNDNIMFIGKITKLGIMYYYNEDSPSTTNNNDENIISSKINGSVVYCYDMDPEISENFYMKRWF
uniref:Uncharacterized protein n=1 Tax=Florenciella sp. virus SA2 TaxID=3240092 RepID=A0AB39JBV5_9VIRU